MITRVDGRNEQFFVSAKEKQRSTILGLDFRKAGFQLRGDCVKFFLLFRVKIVDIQSGANHPLPPRIKDGVAELCGWFRVL